jgi:predicted ATPase
MSRPLGKLTIEGYKSIRKAYFGFLQLNVLIGANGAGKSNFISFFRLLRALMEDRLDDHVEKEGGADACLYLGTKETPKMGFWIEFGHQRYSFSLEPTAKNRLLVSQEVAFVDPSRAFVLQSGGSEARLPKDQRDPGFEEIRRAISNWVVYHFQDTSALAGVRRQRNINDDQNLRPDAENLAAFLYRIQHTHPGCYTKIRDVVRLAAPFFDDFKLRPVARNPELIQLEWTQKGTDYPFLPSQLSDGTLRFICLATALHQPSPPSLMLFDEPELGLHPYAMSLLGALFSRAATKYEGHPGSQIIVATQSATLLDEFAPEDVVVVTRTQGESFFRRLGAEQLSEWLEEYSLGDLWRKNVIQGGPTREDTPVEAIQPVEAIHL